MQAWVAECAKDEIKLEIFKQNLPTQVMIF
jgi:hypothetical protein